MPGRGDLLVAITDGPAPASHQFGGGGPYIPKAVNATFDGSGAAGAFLPCLVITGPSGAEIARIPAPAVAAGASAEVSWFPGGELSGVGGSTPSGVAYAYFTADDLFVTGPLVGLVPGQTNMILWPLWYLLVGSIDLNYAGAQVIAQTPSWQFGGLDLPSGGETRYVTSASGLLVGDNSTGNPPLFIAGEPLQAQVVPPGGGPFPGAVGHAELYVGWQGVTITP